MSTAIAKGLTEDLMRVNARITWWVQNQHHFATIVPQLELLGADINVAYKSLDVNIAGNKDTLLSVYRIMRQNGYKPNSRPEAGAATYSAYWDNPNAEAPRLWIYFTSTVCHRVQTGTKMVEVPVYEVQCGDGEAIALPEEPATTEEQI